MNKFTCEECNSIHEREETFSDLPLNVKGIKGVAESLSLFNSEERFEGENQYFCEKCGKKVNAKKQTRIRTAPPILTLGLNRFEIDFKTYDRKKVPSMAPIWG